MRVLFVEDDAMNRRVVRDMLGVAGLDMAEAPEADTGLRMIGENDYDLILMDLRMPGMDGLSAIRSIRARGDQKANLPIIVVTADMAVNIRENCLEAGANDVILKPVAMDLLFDAIGRTIAANAGDDVLS
jgi:two-component system response regulator QseB